MVQVLVFSRAFSGIDHFQQDVKPGEVAIFGDDGLKLLLLTTQQFADDVRQFLHEAVFFFADGDVTGSGRNNGSEVGLSVFVFDF